MTNLIRFTPGRQYQVTSPGDVNCTWMFKVVRRTDKSIWVDLPGEFKGKRLRVFTYSGVERAKPFGNYSMSPVLRADRTWSV